MATTTQFTVDGNTTALYHVDGTVGSAGKKDNAEGTAARDITENGTVASATGKVIPTSDGAYSVAGTSASDYLSMAPAVGTGAYSVELRWKNAGTASGNLIFSNGTTGDYQELRILSDAESTGNAGKLYFEGNFSGSLTALRGSTAINDDAWHFVVVTYDASGTNSVKLYVDGAAETLTVMGGDNSRTGTHTDGTFTIFARAGGGAYSNGTTLTDEIRFSNIARTSTEISDYYNTSSPSSSISSSPSPSVSPSTSPSSSISSSLSSSISSSISSSVSPSSSISSSPSNSPSSSISSSPSTSISPSPSPVWTPRSKPTTNWTVRTSPGAATWTKRTKPTTTWTNRTHLY